MKIVLFTHPHFLKSQSMPRFANLISNGMKERGHEVILLTAIAKFYNLPVPQSFKKWLGYIDQYIIFPQRVKKKLKHFSEDTIFVFADQALGPWIPLVADRPHIIHCHDFLAQRSARREIAENPTTFSGRTYQAYIRQGYKKGKNFISVSKKTQADLHDFLEFIPPLSEVVYNGLNQNFGVDDSVLVRKELSSDTGLDLSQGFLLHVGGNQWYKNRIGVIEIFDKWKKFSKSKVPLLLIGPYPNAKLLQIIKESPFNSDIHFLSGKSDSFIKKAYQGASVLLFPSLAEGFGWPIAEAMACGCPVITTDEAPMTEVGADVAFYIRNRPVSPTEVPEWAENSARVVQQVFDLSIENREQVIRFGLTSAGRFNANDSLNRIEDLYNTILKKN